MGKKEQRSITSLTTSFANAFDHYLFIYLDAFRILQSIFDQL